MRLNELNKLHTNDAQMQSPQTQHLYKKKLKNNQIEENKSVVKISLKHCCFFCWPCYLSLFCTIDTKRQRMRTTRVLCDCAYSHRLDENQVGYAWNNMSKHDQDSFNFVLGKVSCNWSLHIWYACGRVASVELKSSIEIYCEKKAGERI